jgi:hypothetical protein
VVRHARRGLVDKTVSEELATTGLGYRLTRVLLHHLKAPCIACPGGCQQPSEARRDIAATNNNDWAAMRLATAVSTRINLTGGA